MLAVTALLSCLAAAASSFPRARAAYSAAEPEYVDIGAGSYTHPMLRHARLELGGQVSSADIVASDDLNTPGHPGRSLLHPRTTGCHRRRCEPVSAAYHAHAHIAVICVGCVVVDVLLYMCNATL